MKHKINIPGFRKWSLRVLTVFTIAACVYLSIDYRGPSIIPVRKDVAFGFSCLRAHDLVVQEYDSTGNLWATRGMIIYCLKKGATEFKRVAHVPTGLTIYWMRNFSFVRKLTLRPECIELTATGRGDLYALSAGRLWQMKRGDRKFRDVLLLNHYGVGDQGIRNDGILKYKDNSIFLGEYFTNPKRELVRVFEYLSDSNQVKVACSFDPGQIRHIHALQEDPYTGRLWICTGDADEESIIAWSEDKFKTIHKVTSGSQFSRSCQLVFTNDAVFWGSDTGDGTVAGIYKWNKNNGEIKKVQKLEGAVFYATRLKNGTTVFSMDREGANSEKDIRTRLYTVSEDGLVKEFVCGTWNHKKPGMLFKYALLRLQRCQDGPSLAMTCLNQKEFPDSELIIISEKALNKSSQQMN